MLISLSFIMNGFYADVDKESKAAFTPGQRLKVTCSLRPLHIFCINKEIGLGQDFYYFLLYDV